MTLDLTRNGIALDAGSDVAMSSTEPWTQFADTHKPGDRIETKIRSVTDFGVFVDLGGEVVGLIRLEDLDCEGPAEPALRRYERGDAITVWIISIDSRRQRIRVTNRRPGGGVASAFFSPPRPNRPKISTAAKMEQ